MNIEKPRALVIGLDSAPLDLLLPWIEKGYLPNLGKVFLSGAFGNALSILPTTPVAWSSIYTGKNPGKHGIFGFRSNIPKSYEHIPVNASMRDSKDIWEILSEHGLRVGVVAAPLTYPARPVNGFLVCGFMAPSTTRAYTYPESLRAEVDKVVSELRLRKAPPFSEQARLVEIQNSAKALGSVACHMVRDHPWDFFFVTFSDTDHVQHIFWNNREAVLSVYRIIDGFVGELLKEVDSGSYVLVVSDHGAEPLRKNFHIADFLRQSGFIRLQPFQRGVLRKMSATPAFFRMGAILQSLSDPLHLRRFLRPLASRAGDLAEAAPASTSNVEWSETLAYPSSSYGIRINLKGKFPMGRVSEGEEYSKVRENVIREILRFKDPENGASPVEDALPRESVFSGPHSEDGPDILLVTSPGYLSVPQPSIGGSGFSANRVWVGKHSMKAVMAISGPGVAKGTVLNDVSLVDVAPTILYAFRIPIPADMDGKVVTAAFAPEHLAANPPEYGPASGGSGVSAVGLPLQDEREIAERLKRLGYVD